MSGQRNIFDFQSFLSDFLKHECQNQNLSLSCESTFLGSKCMYLLSMLPFPVKTYRPGIAMKTCAGLAHMAGSVLGGGDVDLDFQALDRHSCETTTQPG